MWCGKEATDFRARVWLCERMFAYLSWIQRKCRGIMAEGALEGYPARELIE